MHTLELGHSTPRHTLSTASQSTAAKRVPGVTKITIHSALGAAEVWKLGPVPEAVNSLQKTFFSGFPRWLNGKESACQCRRHRLDPWSGKILHAMEQLSQ